METCTCYVCIGLCKKLEAGSSWRITKKHSKVLKYHQCITVSTAFEQLWLISSFWFSRQVGTRLDLKFWIFCTPLSLYYIFHDNNNKNRSIFDPSNASDVRWCCDNIALPRFKYRHFGDLRDCSVPEFDCLHLFMRKKFEKKNINSTCNNFV